MKQEKKVSASANFGLLEENRFINKMVCQFKSFTVYLQNFFYETIMYFP